MTRSGIRIGRTIGVQKQDVASQDFSLALEMTFQAARGIGGAQEYSKDVPSNKVFQSASWAYLTITQTLPGPGPIQFL